MNDIKPCLHPRAGHQHGTYLAYKLDGCRCVPCCTAHRKHAKLSVYKTATGTHSYVPAEPARQHVKHLMQTLTVGQIEQRSGVNRTSIRVLLGDFPGRPASRRIMRSSEAALLAVTADRVGPEAAGLVDSVGTQRRLRALVALGWPAKHLGRRLGLSTRTTWELTRSTAPEDQMVRVSTRDAIRRLYDEMSLTLPSPSPLATRIRRAAAARGWVPPLAWDDDEIDDPAAKPAAATRPEGRRNLDPDLDDRVMELTRAGLSAAEIALRLRTYKRHVQRVRARHRDEEKAS